MDAMARHHRPNPVLRGHCSDMDVCLCGQLANREPQTGQFEVPLASLQRGACSVKLQDVELSCDLAELVAASPSVVAFVANERRDR